MPAPTRPATAPVAAANGKTPTHGARIEPFYLPVAREIEVFQACAERALPVMLKGPTGCGKTRFVQYMAWRLDRALITVACHDDLSASDLTGRYLVHGGETVWQDGPLATAVRQGAICYLDEIVEARADTVVVVHPLTDDRRILPIDKRGEILEAAPGFLLVVSYNPGYQHALKDLKPSTRQRFVTLEFDFPTPDAEAAIVAREGGVEESWARALVALATRVRGMRDRGLSEVPSTRLLVAAARLIRSGIGPQDACRSAFAGPLTDDSDLLAAILDVVAATFP